MTYINRWLDTSKHDCSSASEDVIRIALRDRTTLQCFMKLCNNSKVDGGFNASMAGVAGGTAAVIASAGTATVPLAQLSLGQILGVITTGALPTATVITNPFLLTIGAVVAAVSAVRGLANSSCEEVAKQLYYSRSEGLHASI